jgi:hypothetical protein
MVAGNCAKRRGAVNKVWVSIWVNINDDIDGHRHLRLGT